MDSGFYQVLPGGSLLIEDCGDGDYARFHRAPFREWFYITSEELASLAGRLCNIVEEREAATENEGENDGH